MGAAQSKSPKSDSIPRRRLTKRNADASTDSTLPVAAKPPSTDRGQSQSRDVQSQRALASRSIKEVATVALPRANLESPPPPPPPQQLSALEAHNLKYRETQEKVDRQTGERQEFQDIWHQLAHRTSDDSLDSIAEEEEDAGRPPGERQVAKLSNEIWQHIATFLKPEDAASLALCNRTLLNRLGYRPFEVLRKPENFLNRITFLLHVDHMLPLHLLCFNCGKYHRRSAPGTERLQPSNVLNPLFNCPLATNPTVIIPRARIVPGYALPFTFAQLSTRAQRFGPEFGLLASSLGRRFTDKQSGWTHSIAFHVNGKNNHLLLRVSSWVPAESDLPPAGMRHLIFDKNDYTPHYSVCAHWRDGELVHNTKCALGHIPGAGPNLLNRLADGTKREFSKGFVGSKSIGIGGGTGPAGQCAICKPMRRCPECPTEYLIELKLQEDKRRPADDDWEPKSRKKASLVTCLSVTRWSDLGDGQNPFETEWAAVTGNEAAERYDSFAKIGGRTIAGIFESRYGETSGSQRVLNLNPSGEKKGEKGHRWY